MNLCKQTADFTKKFSLPENSEFSNEGGSDGNLTVFDADWAASITEKEKKIEKL